MLHLFRSAAARAFTYALIGVIVAGLLIGVIRLALPFADLFRSELEGVLSEKLGLEVRVGRLGLRLAGRVPQLTLIDAQLVDPDSGRTQLSLEQLRIDLSLVSSVRELEPHIESLTLVGARLAVKRLADGTIRVAGLEGIEGGDPAAMTFFLGNGRFLLADSEVRWVDETTAARAAPLFLADVQVRFENTGERHRIGILARPFGNRGSHLRLAGDLHGKPGNPADWSGQLYLHLRGENLEPALKGRLPASLNLGSAKFELESWNDLARGALTESSSLIAVRGLSAWSESRTKVAAPAHLDLLEAQIQWRNVGGGWHLDVQDLALLRSGVRQTESDVEIRVTNAEEAGRIIRGGNRFLDLAGVCDLLAQLPETLTKGLGPLQDARLEGKLRDLRFRVEQRPDLAPAWALSGRVEALMLEARDQVPGVEGLNAKFTANESRGTLELGSEGVSLDLPLLFPESIRLDELSGEIQWLREPDGTLKVSAGEISAGNEDIATRSRFALALPPRGGSPFLDLQTNFRDLALASIRRYVPSQRLKKKKLLTWLENAFDDGRVPAGTLLFRGVLAQFPFDAQEGRFQVLLDVEDGTVNYHKDWPPLEELRGEVQFLNRGMDVFVSRARFLDSDLVSGYAYIPNLKKAATVAVLARAEGPFADALRALGETPLHKKLGAIADTFEARGSSRLDLAVAVPLPRKEGKVPLQLDGDLTWPGPANLTVKDLGIELTDLDGGLRFNARSILGRSIEARLWGEPVSLHIEPGPPDEDGKTATHIQASGAFPTQVLAQRFSSPIWDIAKGRSRWELRLDVGRGAEGETLPPIDFELGSDLAGVAVELPSPLGKPAPESRPLRFAGRLVKDRELPVQGGYGNLGIGLGLTRADDRKLRIAHASFNLGGRATPPPRSEGFYLSGSIPTLDLTDWLNWWSGRTSSGADSGERPRLRSADLRVERLLFTDMAINDVRLDLDQRENRWEAKLDAREVAGRISIPHRSRREPVRIELERLDLKAVLGYEGAEGRALSRPKRRPDPRLAHTLDLGVERLTWGDNPLGRVALRSQSEPDGLDFTDISLDGPFMSIRGRGSWKQQGEDQRTSVAIKATGSDLGEFLRSLEFKSLFYKAPAVVDLALDWPGGPADFSAVDLQGNATIEVGAGSLLEVEPGVGRMLGILNFEALQRRLSLDFSDLFDRGYAFEKIAGKLDVRKGKADIENLVIEGPSANLSITGYTDLAAKEFNQIVTVTPRIGTGVALATAVAGGPLVGAAVLLADRVSGGILDQLGQHQYVLRGPWDKPEIQRGKLGDDGQRETEKGHFLGELGRAGAESAGKPKPPEARATGAVTPAETKPDETRPKPAPSREEAGENLFLPGH